MRVGLGALAVIAALAGFAAPANAAARCKPGHKVLAREPGHVVIWATVTRHGHRATDRLYICVPPHGGTHLLGKEPGSAYPHVTHLEAAGHFVGFFLATSSPFYVGPYETSLTGVDLYVFDTASGRVDMTDPVSCQGSVCASLPVMSKYFLAPNGWVAELYEITDTHPHMTSTDIRALIATYAPAATRKTRQSLPLDFGFTISPLALSGETATWTSDLSGASSAALGPSLVPSSAPQASGACQLLSTTDVSPLLGPASSSASPAQCEYVSESNPSKTLSLSFRAGLSSQQVDSDANALQNNNAYFPILLNYGDYRIYVTTSAVSGVTHEQLSFFAPSNGSEVSLDLTTPSASADEQLAWLANVAFDRLFSIPVQRAS